ncbi:transketolase C-terminal domain-containing protein, partial [Fodinibius sp.]|uniref:transketolase-like TK C-terminal-containing protein n=1 Tax=Fodinibius sp. TaxID=1872440 RepID=UPI0035651293
HFRQAKEEGATHTRKWEELFNQYREEHPEEAKRFESALNRGLPTDFESFLPVFEADEQGMATRASSGKVIQKLAANIPQLIGGSADLTGSNKTWMDDTGIFGSSNYAGRNIHFGVREHAMGAALNGMALHKGVIPFGGTFLIFSDYCRPAIRIAALSHIPSVFVFTHDSIGLGGDGPTHQPVEHLASLRAMPHALLLRPADANEVAWAWKAALEYTDGPALLALTRQAVPTFERTEANRASQATKGAYILADSEKATPDAILIGTGSEVHLAMQARTMLRKQGRDVRVVSMPSWELFRRQKDTYRQSVLPEEVTARVSIEAAATFGWKEWIGDRGIAIGIDHFGASAPYKEIFEKYGLTVDRIVEEAQKLLR